MMLNFTKQFVRDYRRLPFQIQKQTDKKLEFLLADMRHPSLRVHKIKGQNEVWEGSITMNYRFTFQIIGERYFMRRVGAHDILFAP